MSLRKAEWKYAVTELGTGIECTNRHHKIGARTVVMGDVILYSCKFCRAEMKPIKQSLLNRMKDEFESNKAY